MRRDPDPSYAGSASVTARFDTIDLLRGLSILAVVLLHTWLRFWLSDVKDKLPIPAWLDHLLLHNGGNGVTVFFAVSGFLITLTSLKRFGALERLQPMAFYRIRFARIAPLLLLLLTVLSILALFHVKGFQINTKRASLAGALFSALTFHLNWYEGAHGYLPANWDVLWSLSVEEMFYVFFPITCALLLRWRAGFYVFVALLLSFVVMGPFSRTIWTASNDIWQEKSYLGGMDAIALGCMTALLTEYCMKSRRPKRAVLIAMQLLGVVLILLIALWPRWHVIRPAMHFLGVHALDDSVLSSSTCLVMFASVLRSKDRRGSILRRISSPLRWFGRHSYEVYITHEFLVILGVDLFLHYRRGPIALWYIAILLLTAPLGWAVAHFFSEPMNRRLRGARPPSIHSPGLQSS